MPPAWFRALWFIEVSCSAGESNRWHAVSTSAGWVDRWTAPPQNCVASRVRFGAPVE